MNRMILFGGSFNPVHLGHLWMAQAALETLDGDAVVFMPTGDSPHKEVDLPAAHRGRMVELACAENRNFVYSDYEISQSRPSYTIHTVEHFLQKNPKCRISLLIGEDSLLTFHTWKEYKKLLGLVTLAVVPRFHGLHADADERVRHLVELGARIHYIPMKRIEISSTWVRNRAKIGQSLKNFVPDSVADYIHAHALYQDANLKPLLERLAKSIGPRRYSHSLRVAQTAAGLAKRHGLDEKKAFLAGLLHDCAKGQEEALLANPLIHSAFTGRNEDPALWHTELGALAANELYGTDDEAILQAIRLHTTGAPGMSGLDKVVYIADKTEPGRSDPMNESLRTIAEENLDEGLFHVLQASIAWLKQNGQDIHPDSDALNKIFQKERQFDRKNRFDPENTAG